MHGVERAVECNRDIGIGFGVKQQAEGTGRLDPRSCVRRQRGLGRAYAEGRAIGAYPVISDGHLVAFSLLDSAEDELPRRRAAAVVIDDERAACDVWHVSPPVGVA